MKIRTTLSLLASLATISPIVASGALVYTPADGGLLWNQTITIDGTTDPAAAMGGILVTPGGSNPTGFTTSFYSLCLDVSGNLYLDTPQNFTAVGFPSASLIGLNPPWGNNGTDSPSGDATQAGASLNNAAHLFFTAGSILSTPGATAADKAALQLAVWEVLYDTGSSSGFDLDAGRFQTTGAIKSAAESILAQAFPGNVQYASVQYTGNLLVPVTSTGAWDKTKQELLLDPSSITPVPEASTLIAGFAGLAMLMAAAWRHHNRTITASVNVA